VTLSAPQLQLTGFGEHHHSRPSRARHDQALAQAGLTKHEVVVERGSAPPPDPKHRLLRANPRLVLLWPADMTGDAVIDFMEEPDGKQDTKDRQTRLARVVLRRLSPSDGSALHTVSGEVLLESDARFEGALLDFDVPVYSQRKGAGADLDLSKPTEWLRIKGVPLREEEGSDEGAHWEVRCFLRYVREAWPKKDAPAPKLDYDLARIDSASACKVDLQERVVFHRPDDTGSVPLDDRYVLGVHVRQTGKGDLRAVDATVHFQPGQLYGVRAQEAREVTGATVTPSLTASAKKAIQALKHAKLKVSGSKARRPIEALDVSLDANGGWSRRDVDKSVRWATATSYYWMLPADFAPGKKVRVSGPPHATVAPDLAASPTAREIVLDSKDAWEAVAAELNEVVQHVRLARLWMARYSTLYEEHKQELETYQRVVSPILAGLGKAELKAKNVMNNGTWGGGYRTVTLEKLAKSDPPGTRGKLEALRRFADRAAAHADKAWAAFSRPHVNPLFQPGQSDPYLSQKKTLRIPAFKDSLNDGRHRDVQVVATTAEALPYDETLKVRLLAAIAELMPQRARVDVTGPGEAKDDPKRKSRIEEFRKFVAPGLKAIFDDFTASTRAGNTVAVADRAATFLNSLAGQELVWQAVNGGWALTVYGRTLERDSFVKVVTFNEKATWHDLQAWDQSQWNALQQDTAKRVVKLEGGIETAKLAIAYLKFTVDVVKLARGGIKAEIGSVLDLADVIATGGDLIFKSVGLMASAGWLKASSFVSKAAGVFAKAAFVVDLLKELWTIFKVFWDYFKKDRDFDVKGLVTALANIAILVALLAVPGWGWALGVVYIIVQLFFSAFNDEPLETLPSWFLRTPFSTNEFATHKYSLDYSWKDPAKMFKGAVEGLNDLAKAAWENIEDEKQKEGLATFFKMYAATNAELLGLKFTLVKNDDELKIKLT
jgi:hypothetical protein